MSSVDFSLLTSAMDLTKLVGSAVKGVTAVGAPKSEGGGERPDVSEVMLDLRLPAEIESKLAPLVGRIAGCTLGPGEAKDPYGTSIRKFTVVRSGHEQRYVIHLPAWLLSRYTDDHRNALLSIPPIFPAPATVFIVSEQLDAPHRILRSVIEGNWRIYQVTGILVPWRDIEELLADANGFEVLREILRLDARPQPRAPIKWNPADLELMVDALAECSAFKSAEHRANLLELANLGKICGSVDFTGPTKLVARSVILKLRDHGWLEDEPAVHALGALLRHLANEDDLPPERKSGLQEISTRHQLAPP